MPTYLTTLTLNSNPDGKVWDIDLPTFDSLKVGVVEVELVGEPT